MRLDKQVDINIYRRVSKADPLPLAFTHRVRDNCLCLHAKRAARAIARRYDEAFRPLGISSGQFSLLVSLNRPHPPTIGEVASLLGLDRTTLSANLKPLQRRGLVKVTQGDSDKRSRTMSLTASGRKLLIAAAPIWERVHREVEGLIEQSDPDRLRSDLRALS